MHWHKPEKNRTSRTELLVNLVSYLSLIVYDDEHFQAKAVYCYYGTMRLVQIKSRPTVIRKTRHIIRWLGVALVVVIITGTALYLRPLPAATVTLHLPSLPEPSNPSITWPNTGQAEFGAVGYDVMLSNAQPRPVSTASMAKVITALCVLEKRPLKLGESGPGITMGEEDLSRLQSQLDQGGSHLLISKGEVLTEYQMLQAMLLPSANNIADSLAVWAFGSLEQYQMYAQQFVKRHGMPHTSIGPDASGFDASTISTTADLTTLGKTALANPVIMQIAGTQRATFETAGTVTNTNKLLAAGVLTGLKTGTNEGNTGGFIFTASVKKVNHTISIAGVVVNAGSSANATVQAEQLASSITDDFENISYARAGQIIGIAKTPWGATAPIAAANDMSVVRWRANKIWRVEQLTPTDATKEGRVGTLVIRTNGSKATTALRITSPASAPSILWRLIRFR